MENIESYLEGLEDKSRETVETALRAYGECALWSSVGNDGEPLDAEYEYWDIPDETLQAMRADVGGFLAACWGDIWDDFEIDLSNIEASQIGHDYWLTRNHHGAGFWDRGLGEVGEQLTKLAHADGECWLYVGDDGLLYVTM